MRTKARGRGRVGGARPGAGRGRGRGRGAGESVGKFLGPHTGRQAGAVANAEAGQEFDPGIRQGRQEAKGSRQREQDLGAWYAQLAADYQGASDAGSAALQSVQDQTSKQLAEAGERGSADQAQLAAQDESFAKLVGGPKDTAGLAQIANAGAAAARARVAMTQPIAAEQANFVGRLGGEKVAARMQGIEARQTERERRDKILSDVAAQRKEKGSARVANKEKIREADRSYVAERAKLRLARREAATAAQAAAADAALARIKAAHEATQDAIATRQAQERIGISRTNAKTAKKSQRATEANYKEDNKNKGQLTTAEKRARGEHASDAMSAAKALLATEKPPSGNEEWAKFQAHLIKELGSSYSTEIQRAVAKLRKVQAAQRATRSRRMHQGKIPGH